MGAREYAWGGTGIPSTAPGTGQGGNVFGSFSASLLLRPWLVSEYDVANLYLWASLSDATRIPLAFEDSAGVTLTPLEPSALVLAYPSYVTCT